MIGVAVSPLGEHQELAPALSPKNSRADAALSRRLSWTCELSRVWEDSFHETYGVLRDEVLTTFDEYLNCGLLAHGAARVYCDACKHSLLVAFSCKKRGICPSCGAKRAVKFGEHLYDSVLKKVQHRHCGFTLPKRLSVYFKFDEIPGDDFI